MHNLFEGIREAPNVHPLFLHFPLVLLPTALLFMILAVATRRDDFLKAGRWLLYLAAGSVVGAALTGFFAEAQVGHESRLHELIHRHKALMLATSGLTLVLAGAGFVLRKKSTPAARVALASGLGVTVAVMALGADQAGHAVFGHGIGTRAQRDGTLAEVSHPDLERHEGHKDQAKTGHDDRSKKHSGDAMKEETGHQGHEATTPQGKDHRAQGHGEHDQPTEPTVPPEPGKSSEWVTRDKRWPPRGPWMWSVRDRLPELHVEFNGIDFGHAHLAETLIKTQKEGEVERARQEVLDFIFSRPAVPPDEEQISPTLTRLVWEAQRAFNWAHLFHRSLYDLLASDVPDKEKVYRQLLKDYLSKPEALTTHRLDLHGKLWNFRESKAFSGKFPKFNTQIWAYHWLQAAGYDVQLRGDSQLQRELFKTVIAHYHRYLRRPPVEWKMMPMLEESAPEFSRRFPEAATIFNNLHMLHDNIDDILCRPHLYPKAKDQRRAILSVLEIYLQRNHEPEDLREEFHAPPHKADGMKEMMKDMGPRPPSAADVLEGRISNEPPYPPLEGKPGKAPAEKEGHKHAK